MGRSATLDTTRLLRISSIACAAGAALCVLAGLALGSPAGGAVVGLGLLIGALNPLIAQLLIRLGMPVGSTNMGRLGVFTAVVVAAGFAVGISRAWLLVLGVAAAQMVTAIAAAVEMTRR
jgi:hypothetical protein